MLIPHFSLYVYNKIDSVSLEFLDQLAREPYTAVMSCELDLGVQEVVERIWKELRLMRLYTKRYVIVSPEVFFSRLILTCITERERCPTSARP
jgi:ribosome-interacting GTPase 1